MKLLAFSLFINLFLFGQVPNSDVWLFNLNKKDQSYTCSNPINITNRIGYDNQPVFSQDGKSIFYVSIDSSNQADVFRYDIRKKKTINITNSLVSEYSPTLIFKNTEFSSVVVEKDSSQRVWLFSFDGSLKKTVSETADSVGYHNWLSKDSLIYYKLSEPHSLRVLDLKTNTDVWICNRPSRSFMRIGNSSKFIYGIKDSASIEFRIYNSLLRESTVYANYPSLNDDFIWHNELGLIKSEGCSLMRYNEIKKQWELLFSFSEFGIHNISRFAFDSKNKRLTIVSN
jgi:hypothetical protein